jgi:hypothetical protein
LPSVRSSRAQQDENINLLVVIALFSSQFELENASGGVKLIMDLRVARGRLRDGHGTGDDLR